MTTLWNTQIQEKIQNIVEVPVGIDAFSWNSFSKKFSEKFELEDFKIEPLKSYWLTPEEFESLSNSENFFIEIATQPVLENCYLFMDQEEISKIISWALFKKGEGSSFSSELLQEGFYRYMVLETLDIVEQDDLCQGLSFKIAQETTEIKEACLVIDLQITYLQQTCFAKVFLTKGFIDSWDNQIKSAIDFTKLPVTESFSLNFKALIAETAISENILETITLGDVILLDKTYYDSKLHQGFVLLQLENTPLFQAKLKQDKIKIIGAAFSEEEPKDEALNEEEQDLPLNLHVEIGSFKIPFKQLMTLEEGETIDLPHNIEQDIDLTLNGNYLGKGELVKVGEAFGVRITEMT
ncbi:MAG: FliM/FliN family flagellar motor switch protein [Chlamydiota bacterium]|jgi:type III secretion system YscQ/HrcQ family protein